MKPDLFDVIEVEIKAPHRVRVMDTGLTEENADAFINMAVIRRGCQDHFFMKAQPGKYRDGDAR